MPCDNQYKRKLNTAVVKTLVAQHYPSSAAFCDAHCVDRQSYYRWVRGAFQPPIGFYLLLATVFGGGPEKYTASEAVDGATD